MGYPSTGSELSPVLSASFVSSEFLTTQSEYLPNKQSRSESPWERQRQACLLACLNHCEPSAVVGWDFSSQRRLQLRHAMTLFRQLLHLLSLVSLFGLPLLTTA